MTEAEEMKAALLALDIAAAEAERPHEVETDDDEDEEEKETNLDEMADIDEETKRHPETEDVIGDVMGKIVSPNYDESFKIDKFELGMGLLAEQAGLSRTTYEALTQLLSTVTDIQQLKNLPSCLDTLKKRCTLAIPMVPVCKKEVKVVPEKLPTLSKKDREKAKKTTQPMFFMDPLRCFVRHMKRGDFDRRNYIGVGQFVEHPKDIWETHAWCSSIRTSCGDLTKYPQSQDYIIPSDIVEFECQGKKCLCPSTNNHMGRIIALGKKEGVRCVKIQTMVTKYSAVMKKMTSIEEGEGVPVEKRELVVEERQVKRRINVYMDWTYGADKDDETEGPPQPPYQSCKGQVRQVLRATQTEKGDRFELVPLRQTKMLRAELELRAFGGREVLLSRLRPSNRKVICLPFLLFIDGFGLYRAMYKSLTGIYAIMATLGYRDRSRPEGMYSFALGPHASNFEDVMGAIAPQFQSLEAGSDITVDGVNIRLFAYPIGFLGDMPQQNDGAGIRRPTGIRSCRWCMVDKARRGDMNFNVVQERRYLLEQEALWVRIRKARTKTEGRNLRESNGLRDTPSPIQAIWRCCDPTTDFLNDPCHSELGGLTKIAANILFKDVVTEEGKEALAREIAKFPMPQGWGRLQSPYNHLESYQIQEYARLSVIMPIVLRVYLQPGWLQARVREALPYFFYGEFDKTGSKAEQALVQVFAEIYRSNQLLISWKDEATNGPATMEQVRKARRSLQILENSVVMSKQNCNSRSGTQMSSAILTGAATPRKEKNKRATEIERMSARPNMHIGLHYGEMINDWGVANNGNVLLGEDQHRRFKKAVTGTNHRTPEQSLLIKESLNKTLTCLLKGSTSEKEEGGLCSVLRELNKKCPTLMESYRRREQDGGHQWKVRSRELAKIGSRVGLSTTNLGKIDDRHEFVVQLAMARKERTRWEIARNSVVFWGKLTYFPG